MVLAGAFYPNYFTFGQPDEEMAVRELAGKDPKTTIVVSGGRPSWGAAPGAQGLHPRTAGRSRSVLRGCPREQRRGSHTPSPALLRTWPQPREACARLVPTGRSEGVAAAP